MPTGEADFLDDIDDPRRAVEIDARADEDTGRRTEPAGQRDTMGYTGLEGLLNYVYYQTGALNQFDDVGPCCTSASTTCSPGPAASGTPSET